MTPARKDKVNARVSQYFGDLLALDSVPVARWLEKEPRPNQIDDGSFYSMLPALSLPNISNLAEAEARIAVQFEGRGMSDCDQALEIHKNQTAGQPEPW